MKQRATLPKVRSKPGTGESGFSLVEILVALLVGAIVIVGMYQGYNTLHKWLISDRLRSDMRQSARAGLETLTRDIEMAGYQTTSYGDLNKTGLAITLALDNEIEMDQQRVGHTNGSVDWANPAYEPRLVYYHLAADMKTGRQNLYRQIRTQPGLRSTDEIVAENVSDFTLTYWDKDNKEVKCLSHTPNHSRYTFRVPRPRAADYCEASVPSGLSPDPLKNIRRITVSLTAVPAGATTLAAAAAAGAATIEVASTAGFPSSGKLDVFTISGTNVVGDTLVTYSGRDAYHFTGCAGVPALAAGTVVARAVPIGRAVKPFTMTASVMPQNLGAADEATPDCTPPAVPTGLAVIDTRSCGNKLKVKWNANTDLDLGGYKIFYGPTDFVRVPVRALANKNNPEYTLNPDCLLITKNADRSTKPNTYAIQIVAYDTSWNDSEKSAVVSELDASTDVSVFGGANDTTVNPQKPAPPAGLTITHVPGKSFAVSSRPPLGGWPSTKLFVLPGAAQGFNELSKSDWGGDWPNCPIHPFDPTYSFSYRGAPSVCFEDHFWPECSDPGDNWPVCPSWPDCPNWPICPDRTCWPSYSYNKIHRDNNDNKHQGYESCADCDDLELQAVPAVAAQGGLVVSWQRADSATNGYRLYRSTEAGFTPGAHIDSSLQIASSIQIDRESRALYPEDDSQVPVVPVPTWIDWIDANLKGCTTYQYAVASVNCDETLVAGYHYNSSASLSDDYTVVSVTTPSEATPPLAPDLAVLSGGAQRALITVTNPLVKDGADFKLTRIWWKKSTTTVFELIPDSDNVLHGPGTFVSRGSQVVVFDSETAATPGSPSLTPGETYTFRAISYDSCDNASGSVEKIITLPSSVVIDDPGRPLAPTGGTLRACESNSLKLYEWEYSSPPSDWAGFRITRSKAGGGDVELAAESTTSRSWTDAGPLEAGAEYTYTVAATDFDWELSPVGTLNTLTFGPVHPGGLRRYLAPTGGPEHYTTTLSEGMSNDMTTSMISRSPLTFLYHNKVNFWLQNTSRSPLTITKMAITWQDNKFTLDDGKERINQVVLDSVIIGGAPSSTPVRTFNIQAADIDQVSTPLETGAAAVLGKVWYVSFDPANPVSIADVASSTTVASGAVPVLLRFTNCDGTVNRDTDMRNGTLGVYLWVDHSFDGIVCPTLTNVTIDVPRGPELGCFSQSAPGSYGVDSFEVVGRGERVNKSYDLKVSAGNLINIYGRKVVDNSREVYGDNRASESFDLLKVVGANAPASSQVMPTSGIFERPLQSISGDRYSLSPSSPPVAADLMPQEANKVHWYFALAVDKTGNWDRVPDPPNPPDPLKPPKSNNYAYFQSSFDICAVTPLPPEQVSAKASGNSAVVTWCMPAEYTPSGYTPPVDTPPAETDNVVALRADDTITYDVEYSINGGAPVLVSNLSSSRYTHASLPAGTTFTCRVRAKNSCTGCTSGLCYSAYSAVSSVVIP